MPIQKIRLQHGWSQQQLAELSGLSVRTIQRIENGQTPSMESLKSLASVFEIDFQQLQPQEASMPDSSPASTSMQAEQIALAHVRQLKRFYMHLMQYVLVIAVLVVINWVASPERMWVIWPALGWGIALLAHALRTVGKLPFFSSAWEKRQVEKHLGRTL